MKKLFAFLAVIGILSFGISNMIFAQQDTAKAGSTDTATAMSDTSKTAVDTAQAAAAASNEEGQTSVPLHQQIKAKFIEGGAFFMSFVLLALIFGLALAIERIIYLNLATTNTINPTIKFWRRKWKQAS